jgi:hypothetical protein
MKISKGMYYFWGLASIFLWVSCQQERGYKLYESIKKKELASGRRVDSLFMGVYLGMPSKQFYGHCWEMNKKGLFTDGENNTSVLYQLNKNELNYSAYMNFYPEFYHGRIYKMGVSFQYDAWAPWNTHLSSDSLYTDVVDLYRKWYKTGNPFIEINDPKRGTIYVKVDGNRRITIGQYNELYVKVDYTDLLVESQLKKIHAK